jgi:putative endopeptidase
MMHLLKAFSVLALCMAAVISAGAQQTKPIDPANMDLSVSPGVDFYQYANGGWLKNNPVPPDQSIWGGFTQLNENNLTVLHGILDEAVTASASAGSVTKMVGDFYASGMDSAAIEAEGAKSLQPEFDRIAAIKDLAGIQDEIAHLHTIGVNVPFAFGSGQDAKNSSAIIAHFGQGGLGLPERDYYLKRDSASVSLRADYVQHVANMLVLIGDDKAKASDEAASIMALETQFAKAAMNRVERRDPDKTYNKMNLTQFDAITPDISWEKFFTAIGLASPGDFNVGQPKFFKSLDSLMTAVPVETWKTYFRYHLINGMAGYLSTPFVDETFDFGSRKLNGIQINRPRWKRVLGVIDRSIGEQLGQLYVKKAFPPEAKQRALNMVNDLRAALADRIKGLAWMSDATKKAALHKLDAFHVKIGYPDKWRDYSALSIDRGSYVMNAIRSNQFAFNYERDQIGKPVDRTEWGMTPPTVNAYYSSNMNEIVFPAGILQPPFFWKDGDDAVNYGGMGSVIGHEMTHGFDDQGRKFDADGNLKDWWAPEDTSKYIERSTMIAKQFDAYTVLDSVHVNGKATLGENTADLGGLTVAYAALQKAWEKNGKPGKIDGFTPEQRFFLSWAQIWRNNITPKAAFTRINTDSHSPGKWRADGPISNMDEFFKAFDLKEGDPMVRPPDQRVHLW